MKLPQQQKNVTKQKLATNINAEYKHKGGLVGCLFVCLVGF